MSYYVRTFLVIVFCYLYMATSVAMHTQLSLLHDLERIYKTMADSEVPASDLVQKLVTKTAVLDAAIDELEGQEKQLLLDQAQQIQSKYQSVFRRVLKDQTTAAHAVYRKKVFALMGSIVYASLLSAAVPLVHQGLQIGTGNLNTPDQSVLLGAALEGVLVELVRQGVGPYSARMSNVAAEVSRGELVPFAAGALASITNASLTVSAPTKWGILMASIKYELMFIAIHIIEQEGGVMGIIKHVNVPLLLIGTPIPDKQQQLVVDYVQPRIHGILLHPAIQQALMQTMIVTCDSILVGIIMHEYLNLGFADEKGMKPTIEGAAIRGLMEGLVSYLVNRTSGVSVTIGTGFLSRATQNMLLKGSGLWLSLTDVTTIVLHKGVQTAIYYTIDEAGGMGNLAKKFISKVARTAQHYSWQPFKKSVSSMVSTMINYTWGRPLFG